MKKQKYTIVELLAVIAIMAIIIGIAIPGLNNLINGSKVERAAKQVATAIERARSEAIFSKREVLLVFPFARPAGTANKEILTSYANSSYGIFVCEKDGTIDLISEKNLEFKWERLPGQIIICKITPNTFEKGDDYFDDNDKTDEYCYADTSMDIAKRFNLDNIKNRNKDNYTSVNEFNRINNPNETPAAKNYGSHPAIRFYPDGSIDNGNLNIFFTEGKVLEIDHRGFDVYGRISATKVPPEKSKQGRPNPAQGFLYNCIVGRNIHYEEL